MSCVQAATPTHLFCHTASVQRPTDAVDSMGGSTMTYAAHLTGISGRFQPRGGRESVQHGRRRTYANDVFFTAGGQDIRPKDRLVFNSKYYDITAVSDNQAAGVLIRLDLEEFNP